MRLPILYTTAICAPFPIKLQYPKEKNSTCFIIVLIYSCVSILMEMLLFYFGETQCLGNRLPSTERFTSTTHAFIAIVLICCHDIKKM